jgi:hypothetical protein
MRLRLLLVAIVALALVPAGTASAAAAKKRCSAKAAKTVLKTKAVRVFTTPGGASDETTGRLFGCMYSNGKRVLLDESSDDEFTSSESFEKVRLNGRFLAWEHTSEDFSCKAACPPDYKPVVVDVLARDLRTKKSRAFPGAVKDQSLVVGSKGTPAWLQDAAGGAVEVHAGSSSLDTGAIDSLALDGTTLSWLNAGQPKSAVLR